jgi:signal transduction histidine kinase
MADEFEFVFQPRVKSRCHDKAKRKEGVGMGLTLCRRVIERECQGTISLVSVNKKKTLESQYEGDNYLTTVTLRLPLAVATKKEQPDASCTIL